jgi:hypothetical protein
VGAKRSTELEPRASMTNDGVQDATLGVELMEVQNLPCADEAVLSRSTLSTAARRAASQRTTDESLIPEAHTASDEAAL